MAVIAVDLGSFRFLRPLTRESVSLFLSAGAGPGVFVALCLSGRPERHLGPNIDRRDRS